MDAKIEWAWARIEVIAIERRGGRHEFLILFAVVLLVSGGILVATSVLLHRSAVDHRMSMIQDEEVHAVGMRHDAIAGLLEASVADLLFLSELNELAPFLASHTEANRDALTRELLAFTRRRPIYERIRMLSPTGMETLRIDASADGPVAASLEELQYEGDRPYAQEMSDCAPGAVTVSAFDPTIENGVGQGPPDSVLRVGIALGVADTPAGNLVLSLDGAAVLDAFEAAHPESDSTALLIDEQGHWLRVPAAQPGSMLRLSERFEEGFSSVFPGEWATIVSQPSGQFVTENGLFTYDTLVPGDEADAARCAATGAAFTGEPNAYAWKNVSWVSPQVLRQTLHAGAVQLAGWVLAGVLALAAGSWTFARWMQRRSEQYRRTTEERAFLESTLQKYMSPEVYRRLVRDPSRHGGLGGEAQDVAVLFADIRGFTGFAERHDPEYVVAVLNRTLSELTVPLRASGGILDKFIGDGFLSFFEPSPSLEDAVQRAVDAARVMQQTFHNLWADAPDAALRELGLGIGVSAGRVIVGNIGSESAMDYTIVGDAVNVAARLQSLAEAGDILVADSAYRLLWGEDDAEVMRLTRLRGRQEPMNVFRLHRERRGRSSDGSEGRG